jgi:hypothetical protein
LAGLTSPDDNEKIIEKQHGKQQRWDSQVVSKD